MFSGGIEKQHRAAMGQKHKKIYKNDIISRTATGGVL